MSARGRLRVLHVLDHSLPIGSGYSYRSRSIVHFERRLGLEPSVLTSPKQGTERDGVEVIDGIPHHRTGRTGGRLPFVREVALMRRLAARIVTVARQTRADVLHAHSPLLNGLPALWAGRRLRLPVVYEVRTFWEDAAVNHGTFAENSLRYRLSRAIETAVLRRASRVVAICEGIRADIARRGIAPERLSIVPNGVDPEWFEPRPRATALAERLGLGGGPVLGYIGSFSHYEGLPFLVAAAGALARELPGVRILLVGSGRDDAALRAAAAGPHVVFTGRVPQSEVRDLYTLVDVLVLPRRRMRLTDLVTPLKPLEAMAMGTPVLASDVGGHAELIRPDDTGLLFETDSQASLVRQATRLARDAALRQHIVAAARAFVEAERTWDRVVARYLPIYEAVA